MNDDAGGRRRLWRMWSPRAGLLAIVAGAAVLMAACSGGSSSPQVASLGTSSGDGSGSSASSGDGGGNSTATGSTGNPTQLVDEWAACMRRHGDPGQADPTIDAGKVIHMTTPLSVGVGPSGQDPDPPGMACLRYLDAASTALRAGYSPPKAPSQAALVKYAECMRANGVPDFPDPTAGGLVLHSAPGSNPTLQNAAMVCVKKTGVQPALGGGGPPPPGTIEDNGGLLVPVSGGNGGPGANG
ncbi:MAG TPA: hypothetical protein VG123_36575 [Streptosporangiaceae bacterium]|nr:hypothetical protein [Streptosporangiaceae bacterium]